MDYTTEARVKESMDTGNSPKTASKITEASRWMDRLLSLHFDSDNYLMLEDVIGEVVTGKVDASHRLLCWPHKPKITAVSSIAYRITPGDAWITLDATRVDVKGYRVRQWGNLSRYSEVQVKVSYTGGIAATVADLPDDLIRVATVLAIRFYKEEAAGLSDVIGVAETGLMQYVKALPAELQKMIWPWVRVAGDW